MIDIGKEEAPARTAKESWHDVSEEFPLPIRNVDLNLALALNHLGHGQYKRRQTIWHDATAPLFDLIEDRSGKRHLSNEVEANAESYPKDALDGFTQWVEETGMYAEAINTKAIESNGSKPDEIDTFLRELAKVAIQNSLVTSEDCERLGINLQE